MKLQNRMAKHEEIRSLRWYGPSRLPGLGALNFSDIVVEFASHAEARPWRWLLKLCVCVCVCVCVLGENAACARGENARACQPTRLEYLPHSPGCRRHHSRLCWTPEYDATYSVQREREHRGLMLDGEPSLVIRRTEAHPHHHCGGVPIATLPMPVVI